VDLEEDFSTDLIDPLVGLRVHTYFTDRLHATVRADVGGFSISDDTSDLSWQVLAWLGYDFTKRFGVFGGYRALGLEVHEGGGASKKGTDLIMHGVLVGLSVNLF
jgi:hypothetical protein